MPSKMPMQEWERPTRRLPGGVWERVPLCVRPEELINTYRTGAVPSAPKYLSPGAVADEGTTIVQGKKLGTAPPCGRYQELVLLSEVESLIQMLEDCQTENDVQLRVNLFNTRKAAIQDLVNKSKAGVSDSLGQKEIWNMTRRENQQELVVSASVSQNHYQAGIFARARLAVVATSGHPQSPQELVQAHEDCSEAGQQHVV